jgi:hypothetical protein
MKSKSYLAVVVQQHENMVNVKFLRQERSGVYVFPTVDDESWEPLENISPVNPQPSLDHRHHFFFSLGQDPL